MKSILTLNILLLPRLTFLLCLCLPIFTMLGQVGIGNTDPKASLDISVSDPLAPLSTDGILIPRADELPVTNPTVDQDGMMLFITGNGAASRGFYFWDNGGLAWTAVSSGVDTQNTLDQAYDEGGPGSGATIIASDGALTVAGDDGIMITGTFGSGDPISITGAGTRMFFNPRKAAFRAGNVTSNQWNDSSIGDYSVAMGRSTTASGTYDVAIGFGSNATGSYSTALGWANNASGPYSVAIGQDSNASGWSSTAFGRISTASGSQSLVFGNDLISSGTRSIAIGNNLVAPSGYEIAMGYYGTLYTPNATISLDAADRLFSIGNGTSPSARNNALTIFKDGRININEAYTLPLSDGGTNQVLATDGAGQLSFIDATADTDDQQIDQLILTGTTLNLSLEDDGVVPATVDLSSLQDGTGTDDQDLLTPTLSGTTLNLNIENGTSTSIDLAPIQDGTGTDDQDLVTPTLTGTTLNLNIESGTGTSIDLAPIQDGTGTDDQDLLTPTLSGTTLNLNIENGTSTSIDLAPIQDGTGTDDQNLLTPTITGSTLNLGIEGGTGTSIDLAALQDGTGTDDQTVNVFGLSGDTLGISLEDDGQPVQTVDLSNLSFNVNNFALAKMTMSAAQSLTGGSFTKLNFDTAAFDLGANFNTTTDRFEVTETGYYRINSSIISSANNTTNNLFQIYVAVGGLVVKRHEQYHHGSGRVSRNVETIQYLTAGQSIEMWCHVQSALSINSSSQYTTFEVERIR